MVTGGQDGPIPPSSRQVIGLSFLDDVSPRGIVASLAPDPVPSAPRPLNWEPRALAPVLGGPSPPPCLCKCLSFSSRVSLQRPPAHQQRRYTLFLPPSPSGCLQVSVDFYLGDQSLSRVTLYTELPGSVVRDELEWVGPCHPGWASLRGSWPVRVNDLILDIAATSGVGTTPLRAGRGGVTVITSLTEITALDISPHESRPFRKIPFRLQGGGGGHRSTPGGTDTKSRPS